MGVCACERRFLQRPEGSGVPGAAVPGSDEPSDVLGNKLRSSGRTVHALNRGAISISNTCQGEGKGWFFGVRLTLVLICPACT